MIGIIGGSGLTNLTNLEIIRKEVVRTPYGEPSAPMTIGMIGGQEVIFLPRHGPGHTIPPHDINYRANIWALKQQRTDKIIAVAAVGAVTGLAPSELMIPDQIIDYTYGREHTFFDGKQEVVTHVDFTQPYCAELREAIIETARKTGINVRETGTYGATQGPRFETAAEIRRMERDGVDIVGMTGMPEAALAKELGICYATIAVSANHAAGLTAGEISLKEVESNLEEGMFKVRKLLENVLPTFSG